MARYLISFNDGDMDFPQADFPAVGEAAHAVMRDAISSGAWIVGGGFHDFSPRVVGTDGSVIDGPLAESPVHIGDLRSLRFRLTMKLWNGQQELQWRVDAHKKFGRSWLTQNKSHFNVIR